MTETKRYAPVIIKNGVRLHTNKVYESNITALNALVSFSKIERIPISKEKMKAIRKMKACCRKQNHYDNRLKRKLKK